MKAFYKNILLLILFTVLGCKDKALEKPADVLKSKEITKTLFTLLASEQTNINFQNTLKEGLNTNILMYEYFYNGGGVATADFNGDNLIDIYFTSNMGENKLYVNTGNLKFLDVSAGSKAIGRPGPWKTGVSVVDINADGKMDIYLCYSGALPDPKRTNQLFVNLGNDENGNPIFEDKAADYGLNSMGFSNQAYFFDYDRDNDLDMILLNHNPKSLPILNEVSTAKMLKIDDRHRGIRVFKQENGKFEDVTVKAGVNGSALSYGLGVGVSDFNNDGWPDFYVSNDYAVPDYLYINQKNGTFKDEFSKQLNHSSQFSMGNDVVDINNDGLQDIFTLDMLPEDNYRQKLLLAPDNFSKFDLNVRTGFHHQYMRNMLQLNNGNNSFSEIGQLSGISNTDWSWAPLVADFDNDGFKDIYVTNGYYRDYTNRDFINYMEDFVQKKGRIQRQDVLEIISKMPASNVVNYAFSNSGGLSFQNKNKEWGLDVASNSNGASYADLDNDGDLDLIVNNINQNAFIFRNDAEKTNNYLQVSLHGEDLNSNGLGAKVTAYVDGNLQKIEQMTSRGYLSAISPILHFGLGNNAKLDSLVVNWNSGKKQVLVDVKTNQRLDVNEAEAELHNLKSKTNKSLFVEVNSPVDAVNPKNGFNDFKRQPLLINQLSYEGPCMIKGDVNNDGLQDIIVGGEKGQVTSLYIQTKNNVFRKKSINDFLLDKESTDVDMAFFDANGDGNLDVYIASGGYHNYAVQDANLQDRLYLGDGNGNFKKSLNSLPKLKSSTGAIAVNDINNDGSLDVFIGGRVVPGRYPETPSSYILVNDGKGNFKDQTEVLAAELKSIGMVTDAIWADLNKNGTQELIVVGEFMPISVFEITNGKLINKTKRYFSNELNGWWNTIEIGDINNDGYLDIVAGNMGENTQFRATDNEPVEMYFKDFDDNGSVDPIFSYYINGVSYPYVTRDELLGQLSSLRSKFISYESYSNATINQIFSDDELKSVKKLKANHMQTSLFLGSANGQFKQTMLPSQVQYSSVHVIKIFDINEDGLDDLLLLGNTYKSKLRLGRFDANLGVVLLNKGNGVFEYIDQKKSGLHIKGAVRSTVILNNMVLVGVNEQGIKAFKK